MVRRSLLQECFIEGDVTWHLWTIFTLGKEEEILFEGVPHTDAFRTAHIFLSYQEIIHNWWNAKLHETGKRF
jgi:hypothetical protein